MIKTLLGLLVLSAVLNLALGYTIFSASNKNSKVDQAPKRDDYKFLSPRVFIENSNDIIINFNPLRQALRSYVQNSGKKIQVYFEYLPSGSSIGINDQDNFLAASLFKVPVAMAVMKEISEGKLDENEILTIEDEDLDTRYGSLWKRGTGSKISVNEAVMLSITESDNTASNLLKKTVSQESILDVFNTLDFPALIDTKVETYSNVKNYSTILKSLYLSSYLDNKESNYLLKLLAETEFKDRLESGLPKGIVFSHKIGEYLGMDQKSKVFSDCGIVYLPKRPYLLCVSLAGEDQEISKIVMKSISQTIYSYINSLEK